MNARIGTFLAVAWAELAMNACGPAYVGVRTARPPPRPAMGYVGVAPGPGYIWTDGFWDLRGGKWYWSSGRWVLPPRAHAVWVAPRWESRGGHYHFRQGHWR
jgi:hypothetical protein